jgi:hypothetical protein
VFLGSVGMRMGGAYLDFCQCFFQPADIARHDYDVRSFLRELLRDTLAHSLGSAGDEDCLQRVRRGWSNGERLQTYLALDIELVPAEEAHDEWKEDREAGDNASNGPVIDDVGHDEGWRWSTWKLFVRSCQPI